MRLGMNRLTFRLLAAGCLAAVLCGCEFLDAITSAAVGQLEGRLAGVITQLAGQGIYSWLDLS